MCTGDVAPDGGGQVIAQIIEGQDHCKSIVGPPVMYVRLISLSRPPSPPLAGATTGLSPVQQAALRQLATILVACLFDVNLTGPGFKPEPLDAAIQRKVDELKRTFGGGGHRSRTLLQDAARCGERSTTTAQALPPVLAGCGSLACYCVHTRPPVCDILMPASTACNYLSH